MKNKLLQIKNLSKTYHSLHDSTLAVDDVTFDIYEKEFVAIVGLFFLFWQALKKNPVVK